MAETRPWGFYESVFAVPNVSQVKSIVVFPGKRLSLQTHKHRSEHWVIISGTGRVQVGKDVHVLTKNQHVYIPKETLHRIENIDSVENLHFIETQVGDYLGEDDITRYEDDFGRS
jgi:mannose-1-phosphate guanylyltransferase/mannose-1-phosphate guanylyltransferase/mannose-6-phosphate isomerase